VVHTRARDTKDPVTTSGPNPFCSVFLYTSNENLLLAASSVVLLLEVNKTKLRHSEDAVRL
jgi:hypothetical protein